MPVLVHALSSSVRLGPADLVAWSCAIQSVTENYRYVGIELYTDFIRIRLRSYSWTVLCSESTLPPFSITAPQSSISRQVVQSTAYTMACTALMAYSRCTFRVARLHLFESGVVSQSGCPIATHYLQHLIRRRFRNPHDEDIMLAFVALR